jgi:alkanesulfonate monooxygenase SsuD/methylene tetrahydromethanopterin reductase-like flavin-dependent oxidoreductase (luciferase family)
LQLSTCLPYMERGYDRGTTLDWCRAVDAGPFATLSCGERITSYAQEMRVLLSAAAALTRRVRIMPTLYVLPMHSAVWAAKEIATLDVLAAGRLGVTVGVGSREQDFRAVGASFRNRHQRLDEQVAAMRRVWRGEPPFPGADPVGPPPLQTGGPPLYAGAMGPKAIRRAAVWADGIYGFSVNARVEPVREQFRLARAAWDEAGRDTPPRLMNGFWYSLADDAPAKLARYVVEYLRIAGEGAARAIARTMMTSNPGAILEAIDTMQEQGCDELFLVPATLEIAEVERLARLLEGRV